MTGLLSAWFGPRLHLHYPIYQEPYFPPLADWRYVRCIHGHFYHPNVSVGVFDFYPLAQQMITVLRHPLEMAISSYIFAVAHQVPVPKTMEDYITSVIDQKFLNEYDHFPFSLRNENLHQSVERYFVYIGCLEHLQTSAFKLADLLQFPRRNISQLNSVPRNIPKLRRRLVEQFEQTFEREMSFYERYCLNAVR